MTLLCPECGGEVRWYLDCPGHPAYQDTWDRYPFMMLCQTACGNALLFECISANCTWWYSNPLHPRRRHSGMGVRPDWYQGMSAFLGISPTGWELREEGV